MSSLFSVLSGVFFAFVAISSWKHPHTQCSLLLSSKAVCDMRSDGDAPFSNIQFHKFYIICFALLRFMLIQFFDVTMRLHWVTRCLHLWFWPMTLSHISHIEYAIVFISRRKKNGSHVFKAMPVDLHIVFTVLAHWKWDILLFDFQLIHGTKNVNNIHYTVGKKFSFDDFVEIDGDAIFLIFCSFDFEVSLLWFLSRIFFNFFSPFY